MSIPHATPDSKLPADSGVYCIRNVVTGLVYIGSSVNIRRRQQRHLSNLHAGTHVNPYLQSAFTKYGAAAFTWSVLALAPRDHLVQIEGAWIAEYQSIDRTHGYNLLGPEEGRLVPTAETRAKLSRAARSRAPISEETRAKQRASQSNRSPEHRAKLGQSERCRGPEAQARKRAAALAQHARGDGLKPGWKHTPEALAKLTAAARNHGAQRRARRLAAPPGYTQSTFEDFE